MSSVKIGIKNTLNNWRHSIGAILSVAVGFSALTLFNGYISVVEDLYEDNYARRSMFGDVFIEQTKNGQAIDFEDSRITMKEQEFMESFFKKNPHLIDARARFLIISGLANNGKVSSIFWGFAYDVKDGLKLREPSWQWNSKAGKPLDQQEDDAVMLGQDIAETLGCVSLSKERILTQVGGYPPIERPLSCERNKLQLSVTTDAGQVNATQVRVGALGGVGLRGIDSWYLMMPLERAQKLFDTQTISHVRLRLKDPSQFDTFVDQFQREARNQQIELRAIDWRDHILARVYKRTMSLFKVFRNLVTAVILTISGMSVLNSMVKSVNERRREIGTLRSLGFFQRKITRIFALEGLFIGIFGSCFGGIFSFCFSILLKKFEFVYYAGFLTDPVLFVVGLVPHLYFLSLLFLCTIASSTAYIASYRAVKSPIPALLTSV
ncbi:ABC transporter permease [bacterium]|nr:ABC transporter permease [bacterium]